MSQRPRLADLIQARLDSFITERSSILTPVGPELAPFADFSRDFLRGGKRYRALFCYWGWAAVRSGDSALDPVADDPSAQDTDVILTAASALEIFHAAALVHDDIIDNSDTRRGAPSAHRAFEALHAAEGWSGDGGAYGRSSAILFGDLLLVWSDELMNDAFLDAADPAAARRARGEFNRMRVEVTAGQYLDLREEFAWLDEEVQAQIDRTQRIALYKSAKYSVEAPLALGALLGGGNPGQLEPLRAYGQSLGLAFQLRDDVLGVFGDPERTGKPSGDDLREGKRTLLLALARQGLPVSSRRTVDELIGDPSLDAEQIALLQNTIRDSGALGKIESLIDRQAGAARRALADAPITRTARAELLTLAGTVTRRDT